jgi:hypothetical protein
MLNNIPDWLDLAIGLVSFVLPFLGRSSRRRRCCRVRYRSLKGLGMEWTSFDCDDRQS